MARIELVDGHIIVDEGRQKLLLDTGSPVSFGSTSVSWNGRPRIIDERGPATIEQVSEGADTHLHALIGNDLLGEAAFTIDVAKKRLRIGATPPVAPVVQLPLSLRHAVPVLPASVEGTPVSALFDTGAKYCYVASRFFPTDSSSEIEIEDFYPGVGPFRTRACDLAIQLGRESVTLRCGYPTHLVEGLMKSIGVELILGTGLFAAFPVIHVDFANSSIALAAHA